MTPFTPENCLILIVDDASQNLQLLGDILEQAGYFTTFATSGRQAIERVKTANPDLILLDLMMPDMDGLEVCERLKLNAELADIPVIFITACPNQKSLLDAFEKGAVDYVIKPFNVLELLARVRTHLELKYSRDRLKKLLRERSQLTKELQRLATTDPLTGAWNRRQFFTLAEREFNRACRYHCPFCLFMIDIDYFKKINDTYGHATGDLVLIQIAKAIASTLRESDFFGRIGGEEFVAILPETTLDNGAIVADRLRKNLANLDISAQGKPVKITASIGLAIYQVEDESIDAILQRADEALYQAKNHGRDRIFTAPESCFLNLELSVQ